MHIHIYYIDIWDQSADSSCFALSVKKVFQFKCKSSYEKLA